MYRQILKKSYGPLTSWSLEIGGGLSILFKKKFDNFQKQYYHPYDGKKWALKYNVTVMLTPLKAKI